MNEASGSPATPLRDLSYGEAVHETRQDFARLRHLHAVDWEVDLDCVTVALVCACDKVPRDPASLKNHIIKAVRDARGPVKR